MDFPARAAASILFLSIFGHKIGVLKSPALFQGKELQVTCFKIMCFWLRVLSKKDACSHYTKKFALVFAKKIKNLEITNFCFPNSGST